MQKKHYGFLYVSISAVVDGFKYLNLVELFKFVARKFNNTPLDKVALAFYNRTGTDIFIVSKWTFLLVLWHWQISNTLGAVILWYLIITNVFTYFYYHIWCREAVSADDLPIDQVRRRFLNLLFAAMFSTLSFAFLYSCPYRGDFDWAGRADKTRAILFSFSNSLAANYEVVKPKSDFANGIANLQLLISFVFFTVILSRSLPQTKSKV